ncbi:prepilin-type N-terminal cleavage/methylation domain-containing protein [Verminephrobacter aporrectodeae subsp. tuberculatae]|uniref:Type II secretion system protein H n=1 Tax=Verminephrobacter aporrectodeae subsp. tuberculatae TaxID=1110392 RepID=A0ABT3KR79_9BURK|nr:prepilin-type N-terminal cleavage/methylation domain-containing protein [Verminephrobacter aporrectodeae subsp. tuberculatae]
MTKSSDHHPCSVPQGFTLIELLVTLALAVTLGSLAAPSVRDFIVRSKLTNLGNEFKSSVLKARNEAVNRNTCVTLCMSSSAGDAAPQCTATGADWEVGWIAFLNPSCDSGATAPKDDINMLLVHQASGADYKLQAQASKKKMTFNARGAPGVADLEQFNMIYKSASEELTKKYAFNICMDGLGRTRTLPPDKTCANYK